MQRGQERREEEKKMGTEEKEEKAEEKAVETERGEKRKENEELEAKDEPPPIPGTHPLAKC